MVAHAWFGSDVPRVHAVPNAVAGVCIYNSAC